MLKALLNIALPPGSLFIAFLILKLMQQGDIATWSWWWVASPLLATIAAIFAVMFVALIVAILEQKK